MKFSHSEKKDLLIADLGISLAFAILLSGGYSIFSSIDLSFLVVFVAAFFTAGVGFLVHELMHKFIAQRYGLFAEFKAFYNMIGLAILFSFFGFIFAAPGAVFIRGLRIDKEKNGKISLAGPLTNVVLAIIFLVLILLFGNQSILGQTLHFGLSINSLLAAFNMIPAMPFDGAKILAWKKSTYTITTLIAVGLFVVSLVI
jgi:Zn-dependent protease